MLGAVGDRAAEFSAIWIMDPSVTVKLALAGICLAAVRTWIASAEVAAVVVLEIVKRIKIIVAFWFDACERATDCRFRKSAQLAWAFSPPGEEFF